MQPREKDPLSVEMHGVMLERTGASLSKVKQRLHDVNLTYQLKPPEDEQIEMYQWEQKINDLMSQNEKLSFPTVLEMKRIRSKRASENATEMAQDDKIQEERRKRKAELAKIANDRLREVRKTKYFGPSKYFGTGHFEEGDLLKTISDYNGQNSYWTGERKLYKRDGRFTKQKHLTEVPPWIGPQYYGNLDPKFLASGLFPENISMVPFKSATSSRSKIPPNSRQIRNNKINRRNKLDTWVYRDKGPHYMHSPDRFLEEEGSDMGSIKSQNSTRAKYLAALNGVMNTHFPNEIEKQIQKITNTTLASSREADPKSVLERSPPRIVLGDLTRQLMLVEKEERVRSRSPPSKLAEYISDGPTPTKMKAIQMLYDTTSYLARSNSLSAKLAKYERGDQSDITGFKRPDYTLGALKEEKINDAPVEESSLAPSIISSIAGLEGFGFDDNDNESMDGKKMETNDNNNNYEGINVVDDNNKNNNNDDRNDKEITRVSSADQGDRSRPVSKATKKKTYAEKKLEKLQKDIPTIVGPYVEDVLFLTESGHPIEGDYDSAVSIDSSYVHVNKNFDVIDDHNKRKSKDENDTDRGDPSLPKSKNQIKEGNQDNKNKKELASIRSPIAKMFNHAKLPLRTDIGPTLKKALSNKKLVYRSPKFGNERISPFSPHASTEDSQSAMGIQRFKMDDKSEKLEGSSAINSLLLPDADYDRLKRRYEDDVEKEYSKLMIASDQAIEAAARKAVIKERRKAKLYLTGDASVAESQSTRGRRKNPFAHNASKDDDDDLDIDNESHTSMGADPEWSEGESINTDPIESDSSLSVSKMKQPQFAIM